MRQQLAPHIFQAVMWCFCIRRLSNLGNVEGGAAGLVTVFVELT
jgi:hypothetical protein